MDSNEARRSRVPLGTFRSSTPPPAPAGGKPSVPSVPTTPGTVPAATLSAAPHPTGKTPPPPPPEALSVRPHKPPSGMPLPPGMPPVPHMPAVPSAPTHGVGTPSSAAESADETRRKFSNTLLGVHSTRPQPPPVPPGRVLSPPRWQGAGAYVEGHEPQPQLRASSLHPPALIEGAVAHPDDRRVPNTHITAAAPPPSEQPGVSAAPSSVASEEQPVLETAAIGEAIQQLLDSQTAVPQQVEEPTQEITARDAVGSLDASGSLGAAEDEPAVRSLPPAAPIALEAPAAQAASVAVARIELTRVDPRSGPRSELRVEPFATPSPIAAPPSPRWSAPPKPLVRVADAAEPTLSDRELAKYSFVEEPEPAGPPVQPAQGPQRRASSDVDDPQTGLGLVLAAAILVLGVGGWLITRGGFPMPKRPAVAAAATPAPGAPAIAVDPSMPTTNQPAVFPPSAQAAPGTAPTAPNGPELGDVTAEPTAAHAPAPSAPAPAAARAVPASADRTSAAPATAAMRPAHVARPATRATASSEARPGSEPASAAVGSSAQPSSSPAPTAAAPAEPEAQSADNGVVTLTPRTEPLPETPTRENVQSALDALRKPVLECAAGQRGIAEVDLTVASAGQVTHAIVAGDFAGSAAGSCIARVVRGARFAPFSKPRFRVIYPFSL